MEKNREVSEYRERLNETLSSPELVNEQTLKTLVRKQLNEECSVDILDQRVAALSSTIEKLRSVSTKDHDSSKSNNEASYGDWKVKHDDEDCRVMYREGLKGSPFHTLLVEGCIDGTIEECLCVCWESSFYEKWWPKLAFPSFRVLEAKCLQNFRIDEQICLLRVKAPWPLTDREAILQFFVFEYFKDGLVIILLNSIEVESDGIAEVVNAVRIDFVGGVAIQKVTPERSYLRFIAEVDIKLDLVPPSLINFMSRQLLGNGFKLFKKTIGSVAESDDYKRVLADPLYTHIHEALYSSDKTNEICQVNELHSQQGRDCEEQEPQLEADDPYMAKENETRHCENESVPSKRDVPEIEEEECADLKEEEKSSLSSFSSSSSSEEDENVIGKTQNKKVKTRFCISPEVKQALGTLERVISMVRKSKTDNNNTSTSSGEEEEEEEEASSSQMHHSGSTQTVSNSKVCIQDPKTELLDEASFAHYHNNNSNKIAPASPEIDLTTNSEVTRITVSQATTLFSQTTENSDDKPSGLNGGKSSNLQRKRNPSCFGFRFWRRRT
ncbi:unnamed protein product [Arabidopsis lyrata]|uniref:uncharacterized protein LOC9320926 n=1 Tax=Arabidopsis lyrata subsp. lyrata TaxID=81972 RepID=UPI000A29C0CF|nr:uncharacterized protein LOC9320926 [Arabidopsis lyrata subsp. lyrata]XP_020888241.1 uncharacterized protein LOC9320926 [Arabidopsis lyrata subsp. lyrata]XP_020888242.1 uncharacterized protein LOC9320926 [Arabidopsis lyrata subsp. lyrata]CAH8260136.1 unnamed protein product [Arabidopsis lyrata]|eukprot:XP_020888240.1 uncharacterized protein LOC9320926 [Arabidopsis lyrata subsp. lyrata]